MDSMDYDHTDASSERENALAKLSADLPEGPEEPDTTGTGDTEEEAPAEEGNSTSDGDASSESARGEEEQAPPEARETEEPPAASTPPPEERTYAGGRFTSDSALEKAYLNLEAEFHRRNQTDRTGELEQKIQELENTRLALEHRIRFAAGAPKLTDEQVQQLTEKAEAWGVAPEMLIEQELEKLNHQAELAAANEQRKLQGIAQQASTYLQQHPGAAQDLATVAQLVDQHESLFDVIAWQNPDKAAKSLQGTIDLMYEAAEARRLRAEVAEFPKRLEAARQQLREELAGQGARKAAAATVASTAQARAPKVGAESASPSDVKQEILAMAPRGRWWMDE